MGAQIYHHMKVTTILVQQIQFYSGNLAHQIPSKLPLTTAKFQQLTTATFQQLTTATQ